MKTHTPTKIAKINRAADLMRTGSVLTQMHKTSGTGWYLVPGGEITAKVAIALLERPDVQPSHDGLFPGISQTFRFAASAAKGARRASPQHWPRKE
jgi:hypothetical protein